jgi:uncharacterized repeat protein (TIGR01451 family)
MRRNRNAKTVLLLLICLAVASLMAAAPAAWATPDQAGRQQMTVPTATPRPPDPPTALPTSVPAPRDPNPPAQATTAPQATGTAPQATGTARAVTATPTVAPAATLAAVSSGTSTLALTLEVSRAFTWPGQTEFFTLTVSNRGTTPLQAVAVSNPLPVGLDPAALAASASGAAWDARTLKAQKATLAPAEKWVITFAALVKGGAPKPVLENAATATDGSGQKATATAVISLPPTELPVTGASSR